jgi:hypothetical protein
MAISVPNREAFERRLQHGIKMGMEEIADDIYYYIQEHAHAAGEDIDPAAGYYLDKRMPYFLGELKNSMVIEKVGDEIRIKFPKEYASFIEEGRSITVEQARILDPKFKDWEKAKGLHLSSKQIIGAPHPFIEPSIEYVMQMAPAIMVGALESAFKSNI